MEDNYEELNKNENLKRTQRINKIPIKVITPQIKPIKNIDLNSFKNIDNIDDHIYCLHCDVGKERYYVFDGRKNKTYELCGYQNPKNVFRTFVEDTLKQQL